MPPQQQSVSSTERNDIVGPRKSVKSRLFALVLWLICLAGLVSQGYHITDLYFHFKTTTKTQILIQEKTFYTTTVFCTRFIDILDNIDLKNLTIRAILEKTPITSDVIDSCTFRDGMNNRMLFYDNQSCSRKIFDVKKVVSNEHVCYYFIPKELDAYPLEEVTSQLTFTNAIYELTLIPRMTNSSSIFIISHTVRPTDSTIHPLVSRRYAERIFKTNNGHPSNEGTHYVVYHASTSATLLPRPYDTHCTPNFNSNKCYHGCLIQEYRAFNRVPWHSFIGEPLDLMMVSYEDLQDKSTVSQVQKAKLKCNLECKEKNSRCKVAFTQTRAVTLPSSSEGKIRITAMMPNAPVIKMQTIPVMELIEYILLLGSCLGLWFGGSIWALNPDNWSSTRKTISKVKTDRKRNTRENRSHLFSAHQREFGNNAPLFVPAFGMTK